MPIINLLPPELREHQLYAVKNYHLVAFATSLGASILIALAALATQYFLLQTQLSTSERSLTQARSELAGYADLEREASEASKGLASFSKVRTTHPYWDRFLTEISSRVPAGVYLTNLTTAPPPALDLTISGMARDLVQISSFAGALSASSRLTGVAIEDLAADSDGFGFGRYRFQIKAKLSAQGLK